MRPFRLLKLTIKWILVLLALIVLEPLVPLFILPLFPMYIFRLLVIIYTKLFRPDLVRIISGFSACAASDDIYTRPNYTVLTFYFETRPVDLQEHQKLILEKLVQRRRWNGQLFYPEMSQYVSYFMGFPFFRKDSNFKIENHVKIYEPNLVLNPQINSKKVQQVENQSGEKEEGEDQKSNSSFFDESSMMKIANEVLTKPYATERSPWEILIIPHAKSHATNTSNISPDTQQTAMIFKFHHTLADGFSAIRLLGQVNKGKLFKVPKEWNRKIPWWRSWLLTLFYPFLALAIILPVGFQYFDRNSWILKRKNKDRKTHFACSLPIPVSYIKEIKNSLQVSFNGTVLTAITGGLRNYMTEKGIKVPKHVHMGMPMPVPGHPNRLTNHVTAMFLKLPVGIRGTSQRLVAVEKELKKSRRSLIPSVAALYGPIWLGATFQWFIKLLRQGSAGTGTMSLFPGPERLKALTGEPIISLGFVLNRLHDHGIFVSGMSYADSYLIIFGGDKSIISSHEEAQKVVDKIIDELKIMKKQSISV